MRRLVVMVLCFLFTSLLNGQVKKLNSIYTNFQRFSDLGYHNPLEIGASFNTKKERTKFTLGINGYFPTAGNTSGYYSGFLTTNSYGQGNYYYYSRLGSIGDTSRFLSQGSSNAGFGISVGLTNDFKLFKILNLKTGITLSNTFNFHHSYYQISRRYPVNSPGSYTWNRSNEVNQETNKVSYVPVFTTFLGAEFTMGKHIHMVPKINANITAHKNNAFYPASYKGLTVRSYLSPSIMLGYKF